MLKHYVEICGADTLIFYGNNMTPKPLVSIILRTKNEEFWIGRFMKGLQLQCSPYEVEVVLVDNCSTDETVARAQSLHERVKLVPLEHYIPGAALNRGLEAAQGDYIVCISAHCVPAHPEWLANLIGPLANKGLAAVYGRQIPLVTSDAKDKRDLWLTFGLDDKVQSRDPFLHNANAAYRRKDLIEHPFSETMTNIEDRRWAAQELKSGRNIYYAAGAVVYHEHGIHQTGSSERLMGVVNMMDDLHETLDQFTEYYGRGDNILAPSCCLIIPVSNRYGEEDIRMLAQHSEDLKMLFERNWTIYILPTTKDHAHIAQELGFATLDSRIGDADGGSRPLVVDISKAVGSLTDRSEFFEYIATFDIRRGVPNHDFIDKALTKIQIEQADAAISVIEKPKPVFIATDGNSYHMDYTGWLNWLKGFETKTIPMLDPNSFLLARMDVLRKGNPLQSNFCTVELHD